MAGWLAAFSLSQLPNQLENAATAATETEDLCKMGAERVHLHVTSNNAGSISFYEELGYTDRQTIMCRPLLVPARL